MQKKIITWAAERVPPRAAKSAGKQPRPPRGGVGASEECIRHTSSKGMPRHAYGRWAVMLVCGRQLEFFEISEKVPYKHLPYVI